VQTLCTEPLKVHCPLSCHLRMLVLLLKGSRPALSMQHYRQAIRKHTLRELFHIWTEVIRALCTASRPRQTTTCYINVYRCSLTVQHVGSCEGAVVLMDSDGAAWVLHLTVRPVCLRRAQRPCTGRPCCLGAAHTLRSHRGASSPHLWGEIPIRPCAFKHVCKPFSMISRLAEPDCNNAHIDSQRMCKDLVRGVACL